VLAKRISDIVISLLLILVTLPVMVLVAILIRLESSGPAIFRQTRVGENRRRAGAGGRKGGGDFAQKRKNNLGGKPFTMFKFRSMVQNAEELLPCLIDYGSLDEPVYKLHDDPRVTRMGKVLRKTSLDELPQLFNVLKGDMTLVGPRPEAMDVVQLYDEVCKRRLECRPGLTGLQQVNCRGTTSMQERLKYDLHYIKNRSLFLDFVILLRTVSVVFLGTGAY
jgi:lipopolysaccharide/colanic/teichoic acid biosynthesis glycosyltransferase